MTKIKICGLTRTIDIEYVNKACPDYIGFVFAKSKRRVTVHQANELKSILRPNIQAVGVFVNEDIDNIIYLCNQNIIDIVQLHGDEDEEYLKQLKRSISNPVIRAIRVKKSEDITSSQSIDADYLLLDAFKKDEYGGSGETFDWNIIQEVNKPYFLAGGINSQNVVQAITNLKPYAIDISSGVETDGYKDKEKIIDIITKVRSVK